MPKIVLKLVVGAALLAAFSTEVLAQAETVPVGHPVYLFLKRMETKRLIVRYRDAILPISRREVAEFLVTVREQSSRLSPSEQGWLRDFISEFQFDINGSTERIHSLIDSEQPDFGSAVGASFSNREKYFYAYTDSAATLFSNILVDLDARGIEGDALGSANSEYLQFGVRARGTLLSRLGYSFRFTNAQFWGSRDLLIRDPQISQSYGLYTEDARNFDFTEGYARFDGTLFSVQLGRERVLWGYGVDQKMVLSDYSRAPDFIRADFQYKAFKYTFIHSWILGSRSNVLYSIPQDTSYVFSEKTISDKYFAAHRFELSFPKLFDIGFEEVYIYSNRSVDLAYLNPFVLMESVQRARGERDNGFWAFDIQTHFIPGVEFHGTLMFDDIHIPGMFSDKWYDKHAWQAGMVWADPVGVENITLFVDYTRIEPWMFGHDRSRDNNYTSDGRILGPTIGPNADSWTLRLDWFPLRNLYVSGTVIKVREGNNIYDQDGQLVKNVGGDPLVPHRGTDPETKVFLDGLREDSYRGRFVARFEPINQLWLQASYEYDQSQDLDFGTKAKNQTYYFHVQWEF